jgi:D-amino-acid dehydrogenase
LADAALVSSEIAVIGGGVVGVACALELARRGAAVTVLERGAIGCGCSHGNAGWLTPSLAKPLAGPGQTRKALKWLLDPEGPFYIRPRADPALAAWLLGFALAGRSHERFERGRSALVELCNWSLEAWEALAATSAEPFGYARAGLLAVFETEEDLETSRRAAAATAPLGVPFEEWSADEVRQREPAVRGRIVGALHFPRDAQCEPDKAVCALREEADRAGVKCIEGAEVLGAEVQSGAVRSLRTTRGRIEAREVVLAAGAWSGSLARAFDLRLPILGAKGYTLLFPRSRVHPARSIMLAERKIAVNPHAASLRIAGTLELVGEDLTINQRRVDAIARAAREMLAIDEGAAELELWRGLRPCTPDGMPAIGKAPGLTNLWLATGHQMVGLKTAPATGRLLAELMSGEKPTFDPEPFRADRFGGRKKPAR